ncbi:hypothetical protein N825_22675 [Skermanella stibiiresistens SB22]|uniref:Uncharacterized protein n=1 Tax=Skermanella stibiiresistens SB22 TaxID=1385369 RepID=W9GT20_9PROT|nr:alpha/beta fold hydrolase [Skermanella stibiiresistens]EWY36919.1 hypothetical protein N825_22675 [Skermanella stibiiresistens SB22]
MISRAGILSVALCLLLAAGCAQHPPADQAASDAASHYDYPFDNPWTATVLGTPSQFQAQLPADARIDRRTLRVFEGGEAPEGFWHNDRLQYSTLLQDGEAPLVFVIAGTGADDQSRHMLMLGQALHAAGLHVVLLPSPTHANFIVNASATHLPGYPESDAADLLNVMRLVDNRLRESSVGISRYYLTGYSLGGWNAAYVAKLDEEQAGHPRQSVERSGFGFERVLLINPPLSVYHSVKEIDAMLERGLPDGIYGLDAFLNRALARLAAYPSADALNFQDPDFMVAAYQRMRPTEDQLAAVIGLAFRLAAANLVLTSDVMTQAGYIFPRNRPFLSKTPMSDYLAVALRTSLLDYFDDMLAENYLPRKPGRSRRDLLDGTSLATIGEWLSHQDRIWLITNQDDIILAPGDLDELLRLFGPRTRIFPNGGHMGNLQHRAVTAFITDYFTR